MCIFLLLLLFSNMQHNANYVTRSGCIFASLWTSIHCSSYTLVQIANLSSSGLKICKCFVHFCAYCALGCLGSVSQDLLSPFNTNYLVDEEWDAQMNNIQCGHDSCTSYGGHILLEYNNTSIHVVL